ncbi:MAG: sigma-54-dependent Fis family transcriptional regulator [Deltaproteobacteria bacterium]|nr:sigma-54-dependent Fis family transcriptional regulator [Deltaproteobacteria bacterium]MBW2312224.1 sigma-54-dependent Fis family transcriptional regulator [Deltaproteobacteria bacterium]
MTPSAEKECILVVDDAPDTLEVLQRNLTSRGYQAFIAPGVVEAIRILEATPVDLVITDLKMPRISGLDLIRHVRENLKDTEVIMITGYATVEGAVEAVKMGADEYLAKPFTDEELFSAVRRALDKLHVRKAGKAESHRMSPAPYGLLGDSDMMHKVFSSIQKAAATPATVLVSGESGTGKELVARAIHYSSPRASAPFVPVNCGGIPEGLLESELFGYVKGAFTGATSSRAGFFQTADGGTIFLDEISDTSLSMQVKLLRVLQDKEVFMLGARHTRKVDVRIVAATNRDLLGLVKKGAFREDLFFRLNVITITIPPLRERGEDILLLIHHFADKFAKQFGKSKPRFSESAISAFKNYYWPGNVRELENVIQQLVVMTESNIIEVPDLPSLMRFSALRETGLTRTLAEVEAEYIRNVLASVGGNKTRAAEILEIDRKTLREKLKLNRLKST